MVSQLHGQFPDQLPDVANVAARLLETKRASCIVDLPVPSLPINQ